ncbi:MAG: NifB/NifX family molybdenum-iron cluster-binding protein [Bacteroidales bacterium]|nr:NifB/NifX family molybdenum-iron cluster-binding protein [Bacteroidales bacterium]
MNKTVITSTGNSLNSKFDKRFGRAAWFCVFDPVTEQTTFYENQNVNANHGAGTKASERMVELGVNKIISGDFGPKAKELLDKFNIQMIIIQDDNATIQDIIDRLKKK